MFYNIFIIQLKLFYLLARLVGANLYLVSMMKKSKGETSKEILSQNSWRTGTVRCGIRHIYVGGIVFYDKA